MKAIKTTLGALAVAATSLTALPATTMSAQAGDVYLAGGGKKIVRCDRHRNCVIRNVRPRHHGNRHHVYRQHRNDDGAALAAGIIGVIGGAIIAGALADSARQQRQPVYVEPVHPRHRGQSYSQGYPPAPAPVDDDVITFSQAGTSLEPWTPGWYNWCEDRYRSFDAQRGTYRGYDGQDHFCVPR